MGEEVKTRELYEEIDMDEGGEGEGEGEEEEGGKYWGGGEEERVTEWEMGLPDTNDITPLSQALVPPELATAFSISPEMYRTVGDVDRASETTFSILRGGQQGNALSSTDPTAVDLRDGGSGSGSGGKLRRIGSEEADSAVVVGGVEDSVGDGDDPSCARTLKRPRLVWTPQLHKRFVDVVGHLGIKNAVPKTIMQLMNVEGLTRENVASHLQKYRLYLKRMQGVSSSQNDGASAASDNQMFSSGAPEGGNMGVPYHHPFHPHPHPHPHPHHHPGMLPTPVYGHVGMQHQQVMNGFDGGFQYGGYGQVMSHHNHHQRVGSNDNR